MAASISFLLVLPGIAFASPIGSPPGHIKPRAHSIDHATVAKVIETAIAILALILFATTYSALSIAGGQLIRISKPPMKSVIAHFCEILTKTWPPNILDYLNHMAGHRDTIKLFYYKEAGAFAQGYLECHTRWLEQLRWRQVRGVKAYERER